MRFPVRLLALLSLIAPLVSAAEANDDIAIRTLSTRAETVSGGDVLVRIDVPGAVPMDSIALAVNGTDASIAFVRDDAARTLTGVVAGLKLGENTVGVGSSGRDVESAELTVVNHPITGPVFSGPQERPFYCETEQFGRPAGLPGLGKAIDDKCSIVTRVEYLYKSASDGKLKPLASTAAYPAEGVAPAAYSPTGH